MKAKIRWVKDEEIWECTKCHAEVEEGEEECWNCGAVLIQPSNSSDAPKFIVKLLIGVLAAVITFGALYFTRSKVLFHDQQNTQSVQQPQQTTQQSEQQVQTQQSTEQQQEQSQ